MFSRPRNGKVTDAQQLLNIERLRYFYFSYGKQKRRNKRKWNRTCAGGNDVKEKEEKGESPCLYSIHLLIRRFRFFRNNTISKQRQNKGQRRKQN